MDGVAGEVARAESSFGWMYRVASAVLISYEYWIGDYVREVNASIGHVHHTTRAHSMWIKMINFINSNE